MELSLPEFPTEPIAQIVFVCTGLLLVLSLLPLAIPHVCKRIWGLVERSQRPGAIGILRPAAGFVAGLCASSLLFGQSFITLALGTALAFAAFGRILSFMSDQSGTLSNYLILFVQIAFAGVMLTSFFDVWSPESAFAMPESLDQQLAAGVYAAMMVLGALILFAPGTSMKTAGLAIAENRQGGEAAIRSAGGLLAGAGLAAILLSNPMLDVSVAIALCLAIIGHLAALALNRGNLVFNLVIIAMELIAAALILVGVFGYV